MRKYLLLILACALAVPSVFSESIKALQYNARHGSTTAMNQLGIRYYSGNEVDKDYKMAHYWWGQGALRHDPKSMANLGICYQYGRGVQADSAAAMRLYVASIDAGQTELLKQRSANVNVSPFDAILTGLCYQKGVGFPQDQTKALECFEAAARMGSADGRRLAGEAMMKSAPTQAIAYLKQAADAGDNRAAALAGKMLLGKMGVGVDRDQALKYIRKAAADGDAQAQGLLGRMYLEGSGVQADMGQALDWLRRASEAGDGESMLYYGQALSTQDLDRALFWMAQACEAGYDGEFRKYVNSLPSDSPFMLYLSGMREYLVRHNYDRATEYFKKLGKAKFDEGKVMQAVVQADYSNPGANPRKAASALDKLTGSNVHAATVLASMYINGEGVNRSNSKALSLLNYAANSGYGPAQDALASMYYQGLGTNTDRVKALQLYLKAMDQRSLSAEGRRHILDEYESGSLTDIRAAERALHYIPAGSSRIAKILE